MCDLGTDCHASLRTGVAMTGFFDSLCQREALTEGLSFPGRQSRPPLHTSADSLCAIRAGGCGHPPLRNHRRRMRHTHGRAEPSAPTTAYRQQKHFPNQRPKAATYLCRFAAKARFDNRPPPRGCFQRGRAAALPLWSLKDGGFSRGKEDRNFLPP